MLLLTDALIKQATSQYADEIEAAKLKAVTKPASGQRLEISDARCVGLTFRVTDKGARSFSFRFRDPQSGRLGRVTLGSYPDVSLAKARERADALRGQVANGINPAEQRKIERSTAASRSFGAVAARYLEEHAKRHKAPSSAAQDEGSLNLHILPHWKHRHIATIRRGDVVEIIERLIREGKDTLANRVHSLISKIFSFAVDADLVVINPCARLKKRGVEKRGRRVLSDDEIRLFWPSVLLSPLSPRAGYALRLMLLTGARPSEAAGLRRSELENLKDPAKATWLIPSERTKNRQAHAVPLTAQAREIIKAALELVDAKQEFVFPSPHKSNRPIRAHSLTVGMKRLARGPKKPNKAAKEKPEKDRAFLAGPGAATWKALPPTPHDLRRTFRTRMSALGVPKDIRDRLMNHMPRDVGEQHYDLYEFLSEKRRALTAWAKALSGIVGDGVAK